MKRLISVLMCALMLAGTVVSAAALTDNAANLNRVTDEELIIGDANGDGYVDMKDSLAIRKYCAGVEEVDEDLSDINCDGTVNAKDLLLIKKCNAGVDSIDNYMNGETVDKFTIAGNDISQYSIVYHEDAKYVENSYYAADTLSKYIEGATGVEIPVVTEATTAHKIEMVDVTTIEGLEEELGIETYKYEVKDGDLLIYGTYRGNMYAVYDILEDYLGYRFYFNDYVYEYNKRCVDIAEGTECSYDTYLDFRFCKQGFVNVEGHYLPAKLNGTQIYSYTAEAYGTLTGPMSVNAHAYDYYWRIATGEVDVIYDGTNSTAYIEKYNAGYQQEPLGWNPCSTSDMDYATLFRGFLEFARWKYFNNEKWIIREGISAMSFSICDNLQYRCSCNGCRYIYTTGTDKDKGERLNAGFSGLNLYLANRACRDIKEFYGYWVDMDGNVLTDEEAAELSNEEKFWEGRPAGVEEKGLIAEEDWYSYGYGEAIKDVYPNVDIFTLIYEFDAPVENLLTDERYADIVPEDNLIIVFGGGPCNNHVLGSNECGDNINILQQPNGCDAAAARKAWGAVLEQTGTQMWYWYYPVNYNVNLADTPNIFNIYHDFVYLVEECNVTGIFYEGEIGNVAYNFEDMKAHLAALVMYSMEKDEDGNLVVTMSFEDYCEAIKEYLRLYYGEGYEYIYKYIEMQDEAGNATNYCFINNLDYPGDMYDYDYIYEHYEEMRELILKAIALAEGEQIQRCNYLLVNCEFLGLSAYHNDYVASDDAEWIAEYESRYQWMFDYVANNYRYLGYRWSTPVSDISLDMSKSPMVLYYRGGSWQEGSEWVWLGSKPAAWGADAAA